MTNESGRSCHNPRYILLALGAAAIIVAASFGEKAFERGSAPRIALAVLESLVTVAFIVGPILSIRRLDELQQRIHLIALAIAFAGTGIVVTTFGWLEAAGLPHVDWGLATWPLMTALWAIGFLFANRRYS